LLHWLQMLLCWQLWRLLFDLQRLLQRLLLHWLRQTKPLSDACSRTYSYWWEW
jgi:hypothetical protein